MDVKTTIAEWVKQARTDAGLSGTELGTKLALEMGTERGHTRANISHWETGKHEPSIQQILAIVKITGMGVPQAVLAALQAKDQAAIANVKSTPALRGAPPPWMDDKAYRLLDYYFKSDQDGQEEIMNTAKEMSTASDRRAASNES